MLHCLYQKWIFDDNFSYIFSFFFCAFQVEILSKVNHKNFVNLIGYCEEEQPFTRLMIFEYAPNGSLFEHLHSEYLLDFLSSLFTSPWNKFRKRDQSDTLFVLSFSFTWRYTNSRVEIVHYMCRWMHLNLEYFKCYKRFDSSF